MPEEVKIFGKARLNSDDAIEYTQPTDILDGTNVRITSTGSNQEGYVVTVDGTRSVTRALPSGTNKCIGVRYFRAYGKAYIFTFNSNGRHRIEEFDVVNETFTTVYEDLTNSGGSALLPWASTDYIKDVEFIGGHILFWNLFPKDTVMQIDVDKAKSGVYGVFNRWNFELSVPQPSVPIDAQYYSSPWWVYNPSNFNNLKSKLFQFRYRYIYKDGRISAWSSMSNRPVPVNELDVKGNVVQNNILGLYVDLNDTSIDSVEISARDGLNPWYTIKRVSRSYVSGLPIMDFVEVEDPDDPEIILFVIRYDEEKRALSSDSSLVYYYPFLNDGLYPIDDQIEHDLIADDIPQRARALGSVNGNTVLLGNFKKGYNKPVLNEDDVSIIVGSYFPDVLPDTSNPLSIEGVYYWREGGSSSDDARRYGIVFNYSSNPKVGDEIIFDFRKSFVPGTSSNIITFTVTSLEAGDLNATIAAAMLKVQTDLVPLGMGITDITYVDRPNGRGVQFKPAPSTWMEQFVKIELADSINTQDISKRSIKTGSSYELAVAYYDAMGRPFPLYTSDKLKFKTQHYAATEGMLPEITWNLPLQAPTGAAYYHILSSENRTHDESFYTLATLHEDTTSDTYVFNINSLYDFFADRPQSPFSYDFVPGDLVAVICNVESDNSLSNWQNDPVRVIEISSYELKVVPDPSDPDNPETFHLLKVPRPNTEQTDDEETYLLEIIRPRKSTADSNESKVFYEISKAYPIIGGNHSVTTDTIREIDSFYKVRRMSDSSDEFNPSRTIIVESFNFSDNYVSNYYSFGRPRTPSDTPVNATFIADIVWSQEYNPRTKVSLLNRLYPENTYSSGAPYYGASSDYGGIQYLVSRENRLLCLQENKVGYIPVERAIISDTIEQQQIAISQKLLNPITYSIGQDIGIGNGVAIPSFTFVRGIAYFVDPHEMLPVRASPNGIGYITYRYVSKLKDMIRKSVMQNKNMFGMWDDEYTEWLLLIDGVTHVWNEDAEGWTPKRTLNPDCGFSAKDRFISMKGGQLYVHDNDMARCNFYGTKYGASIKFPITSPRVKTYNSIGIHSDDMLISDEVKTQLGQECDLIPSDFLNREGVWYANFPRDYKTDPINGDRLKGRYITINLNYEPEEFEFGLPPINLLKVVVKSSLSTPNE